MSLPVPLTVRLQTGRRVMAVTRQVRDLRFRSIVPGGFASAQISLDRPLTLQPDELAYYGRLTVADGRSGMVVWEGLVQDPGRSASPDGQVWDIAAIGPAGHAKDIRRPLVYCYRDLANFHLTDASKEAGRLAMTEYGSDPAMVLSADTGTWSTGESVRATSKWIVEAGQNLGRVNWQMDSGAGSSDWQMQGHVWFGTSTQIRSVNLTAGDQPLDPKVVGTNWTHPHQRLELRLRANAASLPGGDTRWMRVWNLRVKSTVYNASGSEITTGSYYTSDDVTPHEVVTDLLGRRLPLFDGPNASIATISDAIEQMAYTSGVTAADVLDDLMVLHPTYYWAAWERLLDTDRFRFEWSAWPDEVRYEADVIDGYSAPGSAEGLYDAVTVLWRDAGGTIKRTRVTSTVQALTDAGITREETLSLGEEIGTSAAATTVGTNWLGDHASAPNAGSLTIARPVLDRVAGRYVAPWEIRPGNLIRVRGILPRTGALNATARDGVTIFRVVANDFSARDAAATLELDVPAPSIARSLADLKTRPTRLRRAP